MSVLQRKQPEASEKNGYLLWGLIALELFMSFSFLGYIHIEPISMTFVYIPVLAAGCLLGPWEAALLGAVFGLASMWKASAFYVGAGDAIFSPLASGKPLQSVLLSVGARALFGLAAGLLYRAAMKGKHPQAGLLAVTTFGRTLHTFFVYAFMGVLFPEAGHTAWDALKGMAEWDFFVVAVLTDGIVLGIYRFLRSGLVRQVLRRSRRQEQDPAREAGRRRGIAGMIVLVLACSFSVALYFTNRLGIVMSRYGIRLTDPISYDMMHLQIQFLLGMISLALLVILVVVLYLKNFDYLYYEAGLDGLTGLLSRGQFFQAGEKALGEREPGQPEPGYFVILDVDAFKEINDRFGHPAGDQVLRGVADCLRREFGSHGILGRLGGDEFVALVRRPMSLSEAEAALERFRQKVAQIPLPEGTVTCSIGAIPLEESLSLEELYHRADRLLYEAKQNGKNQFVSGATGSPPAAPADVQFPSGTAASKCRRKEESH